MCKLMIFGGTTEGRLLAEFCIANKINAYISVATEYGAKLLNNSCFLHILRGKMTSDEMADFIKKNHVKTVIDATHPYAVEVSKNIEKACQELGVCRYRVKRDCGTYCSTAIYFDNAELLAEYLDKTEGNILITTGSKELSKFCKIENYSKRCVVRVLPTDKIIDECEKMGFCKDNVISEKGLFSEQQNIAHINKYSISYLVTKESGKEGGFENKVNAAEKCGVKLLIIRRPEENGISLEEVQQILLLENYNE